MRRSVPIERIAGRLDDRSGLSVSEVSGRIERYGGNDIVEAHPASSWGLVAREALRDPMPWFLAVCALLFTWLGDFTEAIVLMVALMPIIGMDAFLHWRTVAGTAGLTGRLATTARVVRDGVEIDIPATHVVPGDLSLVSQGMSFPADGLIVSGAGVQVDESVLTGEAMPVRKVSFSERGLVGDEVLVDDIHWGAAGTRILAGEARLRVVFTGGETMYGQIVRSLRTDSRMRTPLQQSIGSLVSALVVAASVFCLSLGAVRLYQGHGFGDALLSAATLAVAALPEEFPVVFSFFLALGVYRLAQRQALVRRSVVVENIGRITCICTDKTGTLTEGRLTLAHVVPTGGIDDDKLVRTAATASHAVGADPLDTELLGRSVIAVRPIEIFPFTEDRRREVAIVREASGKLVAVVKGAPETVLAMSLLGDDERRAWMVRVGELASGHKVIACARRDLDAWHGGEPDRGYRFMGLLAFEDPIRDGVAEAVAQARRAGIRVIIVTGDHSENGASVARQLGLGGPEPRVVSGDELMNRLRAGRPIGDIDVVARAVPSHKLDLVRALQAEGEIVAVTGDGVNDVPALQGADVGIAMGGRGSQTAREIAHIVLLDDNFRTIVRAMAEGRQLFRNLKLSFAFLLMVHIPLVVTAALVPFAGFPLLVLPSHVVWLELIIHPTALLVFHRLALSNTLDAAPLRSGVRFFSWREWLVILCVAMLVTVAVLVGYERSLGLTHDVEHARSMALVTMVIACATITGGLTHLHGMATVIAISGMIASALVFVQIEPFATLLNLRPLHLDDWLLAGAAGVVPGVLSSALARVGAVHRSKLDSRL